MTIIDQVNKRLDEIRQFKPKAIFKYSCIVRKAFWDSYVDLELEPFEEYCPTSGFYTWGELIRDMENGEIVEHNVTQLSVAMREGSAISKELPRVQADDSVLKGTAAQMRRLTSLIGATMEELQKAHMDLRTLNEKLSIMAEKDALTGLFNRGKTEQLLYNMLDDSADDNTPVSLGVITVQGDNEYRSIFSKVDRALYDAKEGGRNRVVRV